MTNLPAPIKKDLSPRGTLESFVFDFIQAQDVKPNSREAYAKAVKRFLSWLQVRGITNPERQTILDYKESLGQDGLSALTISLYIVAVRKFFDWLEATRGLPNIARGIKGGKRVRGFRKDPLTLEQVRELLLSLGRNDTEGKRDFALINLLTRTGLRTIEAVRANVGDIRQQGGESLLWIQGKGRDEKDDFVILTGETLKPLYDYLSARDNPKEGEPLFSSLSDRNKGQRLTTRTLRGIIKESFRKIGLDSDRLTAHSLRHTGITLALQAGATLQEAQALARHASINTTLIYSHNLDRIKQAPERKIDRLLEM